MSQMPISGPTRKVSMRHGSYLAKQVISSVQRSDQEPWPEENEKVVLTRFAMAYQQGCDWSIRLYVIEAGEKFA